MSDETPIAAEVAANNGDAPDDVVLVAVNPLTGKPLTPSELADRQRRDDVAQLETIYGAEFIDIEHVGTDLKPEWWFTARHRLTGEPVTFGPIKLTDLGNQTTFRDKLYAALGGDRGFRPKDPEHGEGLAAISRIERVVDHGHDEKQMWRERIECYLNRGLGAGRKEAIGHGEPFVEEFKGRDRFWLHVGSLSGFLTTALRLRDADEHAVVLAISHAGFERKQRTWRDKTGKNRSRSYWYSPPGFLDDPADGEEASP
jgi:hypothetical protein